MNRVVYGGVVESLALSKVSSKPLGADTMSVTLRDWVAYSHPSGL